MGLRYRKQQKGGGRLHNGEQICSLSDRLLTYWSQEIKILLYKRDMIFAWKMQEMITRFQSEKLKGRDLLKDLGV